MVVAGRSTSSRSKIPSAVKMLFLVLSETASTLSNGAKHKKIGGDDDDDAVIVLFKQATCGLHV